MTEKKQRFLFAQTLMAGIVGLGLYFDLVPFYLDLYYIIPAIVTVSAIAVLDMVITRAFSFCNMVIRYSVPTALGLLGTFIGMYHTLGAIKESGVGPDAYAGLATAITTTIVGIACWQWLAFSRWILTDE